MKIVTPHFIMLLMVLSLSSCSSPTSKDVASQLCDSFTHSNLDSMQIHMSEEAKIDIAERRPFLEKFFLSDAYQKMIKGMQCDEPSSVREIEDGRKIFYFGTEFKIKLKEIKGQWKMVR